MYHSWVPDSHLNDSSGTEIVSISPLSAGMTAFIPWQCWSTLVEEQFHLWFWRVILWESSKHTASQPPPLQQKQHLRHRLLQPTTSSSPLWPAASPAPLQQLHGGVPPARHLPTNGFPQPPLGWSWGKFQGEASSYGYFPASERADFKQVLPAQHLSDFSSKYSATAMPPPMRSDSQPWGEVRPFSSVLPQS